MDTSQLYISAKVLSQFGCTTATRVRAWLYVLCKVVCIVSEYDKNIWHILGVKSIDHNANNYFSSLRIVHNFHLSKNIYLFAFNFNFNDFNAKYQFWNCPRRNQTVAIQYDIMSHERFVVHYSPSPTHYTTQQRYRPSTIGLNLTNAVLQSAFLILITQQSNILCSLLQISKLHRI